MKITRGITLVFVVALIFYVLAIGFNNSNGKVKIAKRQNFLNFEKQADELKIKKIIFVNSGSKGLNEKHFFPDDHEISTLIPKKGRILDLLNFYYVEGQKLYHVKQKTLLKPILDKGRVYFGPLSDVLVKGQKQEELKLSELAKITNLNDKFNDELHQLIKISTTTKTEIEDFLIKKLEVKKGKQIWQRLQEHIIFGS